MQIRALMYFDELVRTNSMRQAAENLNVAPTAVSRQIENLEDYFGTPLVERSARGVTLTAAGELLAARAGRTLRELEHVQQLIEDLKGLERGRVTIFANGAIVASLLTPALAEFSKTYPSIRFEVMITSARQAVEAVNSARADMALTLFAPQMTEAKVIARSEITYEVIASSRHALAGRKEVTLRELARHALALPETSFGFRQAFDTAAERQGLTFEPAFTVSALEMLKELVLSDMAATLLPRLSVRRELEAGTLTAIPLASESTIRTHAELSIAPDRQLSFAAAKLSGFIEEFMRSNASR
ncbi:LysR substrate-binding domain-containing protein [Rhizobium sp. BG4]|jgi:DNA-binding transcriptional LysR family regulator|uniref:LysR substrate-binding domain-containing protein n=1 Tax=Rhizobium sp. BG4 TaxID=2613770 RepID=UPI00193D2414|nr:LysR substrate-binding domain-containing protein [Rhizobium sp. BG4]QRM43443.1 LysR family transcriptional regulator [Rhizobium sp. BG4]